MKKITILMIIVTMSFLTGALSFSTELKNLYYVNESSKVEKLGVLKEDRPGNINGLSGYYSWNNYFRNADKYYNKGIEVSYEEYIRGAGKVLDSQMYLSKSEYITEDEKYYYPYDKEKIEKKDGVKVFGGIHEVSPNYYFNYLLLKDNKIIDSNDFEIKTGNIDLKTLEQVGNGYRYFKDKNGAYYLKSLDGNYSDIFVKINGVDKNTLESIGEFYAKDKNYVFYQNKKMAQVDIETFKIIKLHYSMEPDVFLVGYDKNGVYFNGKKISNIKLVGNVEMLSESEFKDAKNVYLFLPEYDNNGKASVKKLNIPITAKNVTKFVQEDNEYLYYPNGKIKKLDDFKWLTQGDVYLNAKKVYFISPFLGITEMDVDIDSFKMIYNKPHIKIAKDKNYYYEYKNEMTAWNFQKKDKSNFSLLNNSENIGKNFLYNVDNHKYYYVIDEYSGKVIELENIKSIDKTFENGYFIAK